MTSRGQLLGAICNIGVDQARLGAAVELQGQEGIPLKGPASRFPSSSCPSIQADHHRPLCVLAPLLHDLLMVQLSTRASQLCSPSVSVAVFHRVTSIPCTPPQIYESHHQARTKYGVRSSGLASRAINPAVIPLANTNKLHRLDIHIDLT